MTARDREVAAGEHTKTKSACGVNLKCPGTNLKRRSTNNMYGPSFWVPGWGDEGLVTARDREVTTGECGKNLKCPGTN